MNKQQELIWNIQRNVDQLYEYEDDAQYIRDNLDKWEEDGYASMDDAESEADSLENQAHQTYHVIDSDLTELSEMLGRKITIEAFTDGEFSS